MQRKGRKVADGTEGERNEIQRPTTTNQTKPWIPPPKNWLKLNSDGVWDKERDNSGLGLICRDENGKVLWAGVQAVTKAASSILAEAEALKPGA